MKAKFSITYATVTPESAEYGDYAEHGWIMPGYWQYPLENSEGYNENVLEQAKTGEFNLSLSDAINFARELGIYGNDGNWFSTIDPSEDYQTGESTMYSLHLENITESTRNRIARLLQS